MGKEVWTDQDGRTYPIKLKHHEDRLNSGGGTGMGAWLWHRAKPYAPAWIVTGGVGLAGGGANLMWANSTGAAVGLTLSSVALTAARTALSEAGLGRSRPFSRPASGVRFTPDD